MSRVSLSATPCPAPYHRSAAAAGRQGSLSAYQADATLTTDLEYTRADLQQEFRAARPRRRPTFMRKADRPGPAVTIFEDVLEDQEMAGFAEVLPKLPGTTLLSRKAIRVPVQQAVVVEEEEEEEEEQPRLPRGLGEVDPARRQSRSSMAPLRLELHVVDQPRVAVREQGLMRNGLKKDPRRRTIFVPTDDTTVSTIHPGADDTARLDDTFQMTGFAAHHERSTIQQRSRHVVPEDRLQPQKRSRMSLSVAPKRLPLQQMLTNENHTANIDVNGQNGGKENMAPRASKMLSSKDQKVTKITEAPVKGRTFSIHLENTSAPSSRPHRPTVASQAGQNIMARNAVPLPRASTSLKLQGRTPALHSSHSVRATTNHAARSRLSTIASSLTIEMSSPTSTDRKESCATKKRAPLKALGGPAPKTSRLLQYAVLTEDVAQPQLYEESWLGHQEVSLTELINDIFVSATPVSFDEKKGNTTLRKHMIGVYHQPQVNLLHKRLQASLLYGALARPKEGSSSPHPAYDIGLRKQFLGLWLNNYTENALRAAAEVVTGRQVPRHSRSLQSGLESSEALLDPAKSRRALTGFLETFFVLVEDVGTDVESSAGDLASQRWRKTILRSLMLVWLLDQAKSCGYIEGCLFKRTATKKSSVIVLNWLVSMMMPGIGDSSRTLRHLDYEVSHIQDPLDEVVYRIDNLAVDLRDGIILSRLMEILLFASSNGVQSQEHMPEDATVTIQMPDTTCLESALWQADGLRCPRMLSQHLKMPCLGRAQKMYNVQVALSALHQVSSISDAAAHDLAPEDIVDGHREKTINFLWALLSSHGLSRLVDWEEMKLDIQRLPIDNSPSAPSPTTHADWLMAWAVAHGKRVGLHISNLTTSFASGAAYAAILDTFATSLPCSPATSPRASSNCHLEARLRALGCSAPFIKQLAAPLGLIPSEPTTISNLALLASRLLPLARRQRAALTLQRVFRRRQTASSVSRRIALLRLAHACAAIVRVRKRVVDAAVVLQRSWRGVLDARIERWNGDVSGFQAVARAWRVRKMTRRELRSAGNASRHGGWVRGW